MTAVANEVSCPKCGGPMWDNRADKKNPKAPDFKCKNRSCDGVRWPPRGRQAQAAPQEHNIGKAPWEEEQEQAERTFVTRTSEAATPHSHIVSEKLSELSKAYTGFFQYALDIALGAQKMDKEIVITLEGVNAIAATMWITAKEKGLV